MLLAAYRRKIQNYWRHDPKIRDKFGMTVALYLAKKGLKI